MTKASSSQAQDTPPAALQSMAAEWLNDQEAFDHEFAALLESLLGRDALIPDDWVEALAQDLDAALADRLLEWMRTLKQGRPPTECVVEWEARDLNPQSAYQRAQQAGQAIGYTGCHDDRIPAEDAPEAAASQDRWR